MPELNQQTVLREITLPRVTTDGSITSSQEGVSLENDSDSPGANKVYGTNAEGTKGWQESGSGTVTSESIATALGYTPAPLASPTLTGVPTAPTPATSDDSTRVATTEFVKNVTAGISGVVTADEQAAIEKLQYTHNNPLYSDKLWEAFESDAITLDETDTDAVLTMVDKNGSGHTFAAASASSAPTLISDALEFDDVDDRLSHSSPSSLPRTNKGEIMAIVYLDPASSVAQYDVLNIGRSASGGRNFFNFSIGNSRPIISYNNGDDADFEDIIYIKNERLVSAGYHIVSFASDGSAYKMYIDGIELEASAQTGTNHGNWIADHPLEAQITTIHIGYRFANYSPAKIKGLFVFNDILTDRERLDYVRFLKDKYSLDSFIGLKLVSYGDSITAHGTWQKYVCDRFGMINVIRGISGTRVKENGSTAYVDSEGNFLSVSTTPSGTLGVDYFQILSSLSNQERIDTIPLDADIILVFGGANDGSSSGAITDDEGSNLTTSFYAAYKTMLTRIHTRCPDALIMCVIPHYQTGDEPFTAGSGYDGMRVAIRNVAYMFSYPIIDLKSKAQINKNNYSQYLLDNIHPNDAGGKKIAAVVAHELNVIKPFL